MGKTQQELLEIANDLTTNDLAQLLNLVGNRILVYVGNYREHEISFETIDASTNGTMVQINPQDRGRHTWKIRDEIIKVDNKK